MLVFLNFFPLFYRFIFSFFKVLFFFSQTLFFKVLQFRKLGVRKWIFLIFNIYYCICLRKPRTANEFCWWGAVRKGANSCKCFECRFTCKTRDWARGETTVGKCCYSCVALHTWVAHNISYYDRKSCCWNWKCYAVCIKNQGILVFFVWISVKCRIFEFYCLCQFFFKSPWIAR